MVIIVIRRRSVDITSLIETVMALSKPLVGERQFDLIYSRNELPHVFGDEDRLEQILHNLIGNAIKFTKNGNVTVSGQVTADNFVEISIADTGIGIPRTKWETIFESFTQADGSISREYSGTGIGLSVTKKLVELHEGEIRVESKPGKGSRFFFTHTDCG